MALTAEASERIKI